MMVGLSDANGCSAGVRCPGNKTAATVVAACWSKAMMVVDFVTTDLLCMRLCSELSQAESNPLRCKAEVGLSMFSKMAEPRSEATSACFITYMRRSHGPCQLRGMGQPATTSPRRHTVRVDDRHGTRRQQVLDECAGRRRRARSRQRLSSVEGAQGHAEARRGIARP